MPAEGALAGGAMMMDCTALLFDLDGVLVDSGACVAQTWGHWAARHGLSVERILQIAHGRRTVETIRQVAPDLDAGAEAAGLAAIEARDTRGVVEVPGARELLHALPRAAWAVVTSCDPAVAVLRLRHTKLPLPDVLITADDVMTGKPDPEGYLLAARRLDSAAHDCVVVEDAPAGIEAARAAGMRVVGLATTHAPIELDGATVVLPLLTRLRVTPTTQRDGSSRLRLEWEL